MSSRIAWLSAETLNRVLEEDGWHAPHPVLRPEPVYRSAADSAAAKQRQYNELANAGLLERSGALHVNFRDWFPLLSNPALEYYAWFTTEHGTVGALASRSEFAGILATRIGDNVLLEAIDHEALCHTLTGRFPDVAPGTGTRWIIRSIDVQDATNRGSTGSDLPLEMREVAKVFERPVYGTGELYIAERDERGHCFELPEPLHYVDTDWGRYLNYTAGKGHDEYICVAPATPHTMAAELDMLRTSLVPVRRQSSSSAAQ